MRRVSTQQKNRLSLNHVIQECRGSRAVLEVCFDRCAQLHEFARAERELWNHSETQIGNGFSVGGFKGKVRESLKTEAELESGIWDPVLRENVAPELASFAESPMPEFGLDQPTELTHLPDLGDPVEAHK